MSILKIDSKKKKYIYSASGAAILIVAITAGCLSIRTKATASTFDEKKGVVSQGVVESKEVSINTKVPGRIVKLYVEEGQEVKAGDVLVEISSDELKAKETQAKAVVQAAQAAYEAAKGQTAAAQAQSDKANNGARTQEIQQAQEAYDLAVKTLQRVDELYNNKKEQVQAIIDTAQAAYDGAKAQTAAAQAQADKANKGARDQEIAQAQAQFDLFAKSYDRVQKLYDKGAVSAQKLDEVKAQFDVATQTLSMAKEGARIEDKNAAQDLVNGALAAEQARKSQLDQAQAGMGEVEYTFGLKRDEAQAQVAVRKATLDMAREGARVEDKDAASSMVDAAKGMELAAKDKYDQANGALDEVEVYLKDTKIVAPINGTVTGINSHEGELVSTGMSIATVSDINSSWVEVKVKETDLANLSVGQTTDVKVPSYGNKLFKGKIVTINSKPDFATKRATNDNGQFDIISYGVKVELDNKDKILRPGMTAFTQFVK